MKIVNLIISFLAFTIISYGQTSVVWNPLTIANATEEGGEVKVLKKTGGDVARWDAGAVALHKLPAGQSGYLEFTTPIASGNQFMIGLDNHATYYYSVRYNIHINPSRSQVFANKDFSYQADLNAGEDGDIYRLEKVLGTTTDEIKVIRIRGGISEELYSFTGVDKTIDLYPTINMHGINDVVSDVKMSSSFVLDPLPSNESCSDDLEGAPIIWNEDASYLQNLTITGNRIEKTSGGTSWNGGALSKEKLPANTSGWVEFTISPELRLKYNYIGLGVENTDPNWNSMRHSIALASTSVSIRLNASDKGTFLKFETGDVYRIEKCSDGRVVYKRNGYVFYEGESINPEEELHVDLAMRDEGCAFEGVKVGGGFLPQIAEWNPISIINTEVQPDGSYKKIAGIDWEAGAHSLDKLPANTDGEITWTVGASDSPNQSNGYVLGFMKTSNTLLELTRAGFTNIAYGMANVGESIQTHIPSEAPGFVNRISGINAGVVFSISREGSTMYYKKDGVTFYSHTVDPSEELYVKYSIRSTNAAIDPVKVSSNFVKETVTLVGDTDQIGKSIDWHPGSIRYMKIDGDDIYKSEQSTSVHDGGAVSYNELPSNTDGWVQVKVTGTSADRSIFGLSYTDEYETSDFDNKLARFYTTMSYYVFFTNNRIARLHKKGGVTLHSFFYGQDDVIRLERVGDQMVLKKNGYTICSETISDPEAALVADVTLSFIGSTLQDVAISNSFTTVNTNDLYIGDNTGVGQTPVWDEASNRGVTVSDGGATLTQEECGNPLKGVNSLNKLLAGQDGWVECVVDAQTRGFIGFDYLPSDQFFYAIQNHVLISSFYIIVYDRAARLQYAAGSEPGDRIRLERINDELYVKRNGYVIYKYANPLPGELVADAAFRKTSDFDLEGIRVSFGSEPDYEQEAQIPSTPSAPSWDASTATNITIDGSTITKTGGTNNQFDAEISTINQINVDEEGWIELTDQPSGDYFYYQLMLTNASGSEFYKFNMRFHKATLESNTSNALGGDVYIDCGDKIVVADEEGKIQFKKNDFIIHEVERSGTDPLKGKVVLANNGVDYDAFKFHTKIPTEEPLRGYFSMATKLNAAYAKVDNQQVYFHIEDKHTPAQFEYKIYNLRHEVVQDGNMPSEVDNNYELTVSNLTDGYYVLEIPQTDGVIQKLRFKK